MPSDSDRRCAARLALLFYDSLEALGQFEQVQAIEMPVDYQTLLAHHDHMTVTLEAYHNSLMDVQVLEEWQDDISYARKILLSRQTDSRVVQFGIMRIWPEDLPAAARQEITAKTVPLGRVLIRHNILREVELIRLWRIVPGEELRQHLGSAEGEPVFGRSAHILVAERPNVQLLEIVSVG